MTATARCRQGSGGDAPFIAAVVIAGIALRLAWLATTPGGLTGFAGGGEAARVALTLARDGLFGDAFHDGSGPTAHVMPVTPAIAALIFRLVPPAGAAASIALLAWALIQSIGGYLLLRALFVRLSADPRAVRWATAMLLLAPVYAPEETIGFRYWEGAAAVCLSALNLIAALSVERRGTMSLRAAIGHAVLWAATAFVHPIAGFALAFVWAWVAIRRLCVVAAARFALASAAMLALVLTPWALRNAHALGHPVLLRSNFGLELALANHDAAVSGHDPAQVYADRLAAIHPLYGSVPQAALRRAGGEVAYAQALGAETWRWAGRHPFGFARLCARHLAQFFFPPAWLLLLSTWEDWLVPRAVLIAAANLLGIVGLASGIRRRRPGYVLLAIFVAGVAAPYALVQPNPRYTYLVWGLLAFAAWDAAFRFAAARSGAANPR